MYLEHFGLTVSPFGIMPRLDFLYKSGAFEESMAHLVYGLDNSEAVVMITGAIGTGKTMAIQSFLAHLGDRFLTSLVTNTCVDGKELLKLILDDLGTPADPGADKSDLLIAFRNFIIEAGQRGQRVIIVIDEAQNLGREVLEEVRQLTNLGQGDRQPVQIILVGQPELEATVERQDLAQLKQRIRVHYKLAPLSRREMEEYIDHRMEVAGGKAGVFTSGALDRIYARAGGVPRVVNTLCNDALLSAFVAGRRAVEAKDVDEPLVGDKAPEPAPAAPSVVDKAAAVATARAAKARDSAAPAAARGELAAPAPDPAMARRREAPDGPARAARGRRDAEHPSRARTGWLIVALVVVTAVAVLAATGRLAPLWERLPFGRHAEPVAALRAEPAPVRTEVPASTPRDIASTSADSLAMTARADSLAKSVATPSATPSATQAATQTAVQQSPPAPAVRTATTAPTAAEPAVAKPVTTPPVTTPAVPGDYYVHVSSFRAADHADAVAQRFAAEGVPATVRSKTVRDALWFRVYLGPFATREEAERSAGRLRDQGKVTYFKVIAPGGEEGL